MTDLKWTEIAASVQYYLAVQSLMIKRGIVTAEEVEAASKIVASMIDDDEMEFVSHETSK